jgi:hypothetical protein
VALDLFIDPADYHCTTSQGISLYQWDIPAVYIKHQRIPVMFLDLTGDGSGTAPTYLIRFDQ